MKVAIYTRISEKEELSGSGVSLELQEECLEQYAQSNGFEVYRQESGKNYIEIGFSGKDLERPELRNLRRDAESGKFDAVLVYKIDRLFRNTRLLLNLVEEFKSIGVGLISATESIDTSTATGKMALSMLGMFAQFERDRITELRHKKVIKSIKIK